MKTSVRVTIISGVVCAAAAAGCGGSEVPAKQLAQSESAIRAASELGAQEDPQAALQLKLAKEGYDKAQKASEDGDEEEATLLLEKATADADLATAMARKDQVAAKAEEAKAKLDSLSK